MQPISRNCLIVDDSRVMRKITRKILESHGFTVREAENGQIALESCRKDLPDGILLDWNMPVMNGIEFLKALRGEFGPEQPPVMFCTVENDIAFIEQAIEYGAQEFIMKPFDQKILLGKFAQIGWI